MVDGHYDVGCKAVIIIVQPTLTYISPCGDRLIFIMLYINYLLHAGHDVPFGIATLITSDYSIGPHNLTIVATKFYGNYINQDEFTIYFTTSELGGENYYIV